MHFMQVHERDFRQDEEQQLPPLPSVGQIERPESAVDSATLQLPSDLSVRSLRYPFLYTLVSAFSKDHACSLEEFGRDKV